LTDDYLSLSDSDLQAQCDVETFRVSGPGGQHRNRRDTAVRMRHRPTGVVAQAYEQRSQRVNRQRALKRLRERIALDVRQPVGPLGRYEPTLLLVRLVRAEGGRGIGARNPEYWPAVQQLLDLFAAMDCAVAETAARLGVSTGALSRVLLANPALMRTVNVLRTERKLRPLR
jgi:hypothetical protein